MARSILMLLMAVALALAWDGPSMAETLVIGNKGEDTVSFVDLGTGLERARGHGPRTARNRHFAGWHPVGRRRLCRNDGGHFRCPDSAARQADRSCAHCAGTRHCLGSRRPDRHRG